MLDELLSRIEALGGEDHYLARLESVSFVENDPILTIGIRGVYWDEEWRRWRVVASGLWDYSIAEAHTIVGMRIQLRPLTSPQASTT